MSTAVATSTPTAAAIYCRISQDRTGQGLGVARQEADCRAWAERSGWSVAEVYTDDDLSAYSGKPRPAYRRLLADIGAGRLDGLIVWHPDRLHRSPSELEGFIDVVDRTALPIGTVTAGELDLGTATGRMTARIVGAVARHESEHKSERIRRKALESAELGRPGGGRRAYGYEADKLTPKEAEAAMIREAASRLLAGDGLRTIVADWNRRGVPTASGRAPWGTTTLRTILLSGRIVGMREHHGRMVSKAEWEPILDEVTGMRVRRLLEDPGRSNGGGTARKYLLANMVKCGNCGTVLVARPAIRKGVATRRYGCVTDKGGCNRVGIAAEPLEQLITEAVFIRLDTPALSDAVANAADTVGIPGGDIAAIEARMDDLAEMFAAGDITKPEWSRARDGLVTRLEEARKSEAETVRTAASAAMVAEPDVLRREWPAMSLDRRRAVLATLIDHITVAKSTRRDHKFDPGRVDVLWKV